MFDLLYSVKDLFDFKSTKNIIFFDTSEEIDLSAFDIAILGIGNENNYNEINIVREELLKLYFPEDVDIIDFGNVIEKNNFDKVLKQIQVVYNQSIFNNLKLIVIGNSKKYKNVLFDNLLENSEKITYVSVGAEIDFFEEKENNNSEKSSNNNIIKDFFHLGYQNFLVKKEIIDYFKQNNYKAFRLSEIKADFLDFEPYFRISDIVSLDLGAVKYSDCPGSLNPQPAGFDTTEICKLAFFAGLSKSLKAFGIYGFDFKDDKNKISAKLIAQTIWHYLDAFSEMKANVIENKNDFSVFHIHVENKDREIKLKFVHYDKIDLWWLALNIDEYEQLIPCSFKDYNSAKNGQLSDRIMLITEKFDV